MFRLVVLLPFIALAGYWLLRWFRRTPSAQVADRLRKVAMWTVIALLILAAASGRLNPIFAFLAALVPAALRVLTLLQALPALQRLLNTLGLTRPGGGLGGAGTAGGQAAGAGGSPGHPGRSSIRTRFLAMRLDHATGAMDGEVLEGPFAGLTLSTLALAQLLRMLELYRDSDAQSAAVLEAYLDREQGPDWRDHDHDPGPGTQRTGGGAPMNEAEALAILGLAPGAETAAVREAHRRLMQRLHPDRGGSGYLAAKINEAKRVLLKGRG